MNYRTKQRIQNLVEFVGLMGISAYLKFGEVNNEFVKGNLRDAIYPITNYVLARAIFLEKPSIPFALLTASLGTLAELSQVYGIYPGTFDVKDIPMYFLGAGIAYALDKITFNKKEKDLENLVLPANP